VTSFSQLSQNARFTLIGIILFAGLAYYVSNPSPQIFYDYTFRVADNILRAHLGLSEKPPSWLNEFVPFEGKYYSVFPLGAVVTMIPFAFFKLIGWINDMPAGVIIGLTASGCCLFLLLIALRYELSMAKRVLISLAMLFGTFAWTNTTMGGAWQLALGFAMLGELGAIYFTVYDRRPFWAGVFFAMAFGNRTEVLLTAPILMFLFLKPDLYHSVEIENKAKKKKKAELVEEEAETQVEFRFSREAVLKNWKSITAFCAVPFVLGVTTLIYNYIRFHSFTDFGYARIPGVLKEPWYNHGIFSVWYIRVVEISLSET